MTIESIAVHRSLNGIKWLKKTGSNTRYIHYNINNDVIFVAYGIGEMLILELLELSYILFQSDSVTNTLEENSQWNNILKPKLKGKLLVLLLDNDTSCLKTVDNINNSLEGITKLCLPLQMIDILVTSVFFNDTKNITSQKSKEIWKSKKEVPRNYDFKDYVLNEFYPENIKEILHKTIENKIKGIL